MKIEFRENTLVADATAAIEAAAPGEGLWWTFIEEYVVTGRPVPQIGLVAELRRLKQLKEKNQP